MFFNSLFFSILKNIVAGSRPILLNPFTDYQYFMFVSMALNCFVFIILS